MPIRLPSEPRDSALYLKGYHDAKLDYEVKHGHWNHDCDDELVSGTCSVCGWQSIIMETDVADMPYCPNCGSKMDEVKDNG